MVDDTSPSVLQQPDVAYQAVKVHLDLGIKALGLLSQARFTPT